MNISHVVELPDGTATFQGTLEGPELAIVIEAGLNYLLQQGAIPFISHEAYEGAAADYHEPPEQEQ